MIGKKKGYDVLLGGTTNDSTWRNEFIELMKKYNSKIKSYNPVVENWTPECIELEDFVKEHAKYHVYVLTPRMIGVYSIAEMVNSAHDNSKEVFFYIKDEDIADDGSILRWDPKMKNSLNAVSNLLVSHGAHKTRSIEDLVQSICLDWESTPVSRGSRNIGIIIDNS